MWYQLEYIKLVGFCGIVQWQSQYNTYNNIYYGLSRTVAVVWIAALLPRLVCVCYWAFPTGAGSGRRSGLLCSEEASGRPWAMMYCWMRSWLCGGPRWIVAAEAGVVVVLSAAGKHTLLSSVVPGPWGIVAGQSGIPSSFLMSSNCLLLSWCAILVASVEWILGQVKPSQIATWGRRLAQSATWHPPSVSHSCVWPQSWAL